MIDKAFVGRVLPPFEVLAECGAVSAFLRATAAPGCQVAQAGSQLPPTYLFCLEMQGPDPAAMRKLLGIDIGRVLHGEELFVYHAPAHVGDLLAFEPRIADIYDKRAGELEFVVRETRVWRGETAIATLRNTTVVRNG